MLTKKICYWLSTSLLMTASLAQASIYDGLTAEQKAQLAKDGGQAETLKDVQGSAWPSVTVYQIVKATPEEVAAVMFDYALHTQMFEGVTKAQAVTPGAAKTDIDYTMVLPAVFGVSLPPENYTVTDILSKMDGGFKIDWTFVKASSIQDCSGSVKFEANGSNTLVAYTNFINPPTKYGSLAKLVKSMAIKRVHETVTGLAKQVGIETSQKRELLDQQLVVLKKALGL